MKKVTLSIIIPAWNAEPYLTTLLDNLADQVNDKTEVIVIDDGSRDPVKTRHKFVRVYRQENQGCSSARNAGIDKAKGDYISFIDADDLVSEHFVEKILEKTKERYDIIEFSWKSLNDNMWRCDQKLKGDDDRLPNPSVCTRVFNRAFIGDVRFNTKKDSTEDEDFSRRIGYLDHERNSDIKVGVITDYMYFYRDDVPMSKIKRFAAGLMNTKKVMYYYEHVTQDMTWLLDEIKKEDEVNEVWLMTYQCDIPEMDRWCRVIAPRSDWAHIVRGQTNSNIILKKPPLRSQVVIYMRTVNIVGGIGTFIRQFIYFLSDKYDITLLCGKIAEQKYLEFVPKIRIICDAIKRPDGTLTPINLGGSDQKIVCDSLIVPSFLSAIPTNVTAKQVIRMCHACKTDPSWVIPKDYDKLLYVSRTAMESHGVKDGTVLHNLNKAADKKALILVSATRFPAPDKGLIEERMRKLSKLLNDKGISHIWLNFADGNLTDPPAHFYNMGFSADMPEIIKAATYVVQLSDSECWSYTCLEALMAGTPLICTPFPSAFEMGIEDKVNAHIVPFDMDFDPEILLDVPSFEYEYDNESIVKQWQQVLGDTKPRNDYKPEDIVKTEIIRPYFDMELNKDVRPGEVYMMGNKRALGLVAKGWLKIIGG